MNSLDLDKDLKIVRASKDIRGISKSFAEKTNPKK